MQNRFTKFLMIFSLLVFLSFLLILWQEKVQKHNDPYNFGISLVSPVFAQEDGTSFLEQEAGIAAYTNMTRKIDLTKVSTVFKTIEKETDTYIVGSTPVPGYEKYGNENIHCFVHKSGWVIVYYLRGEPTAKIWLGDKLKTSLTAICDVMEVVVPYVKYYHFQYPDANMLMLVAKRQNRLFRIMIPGSFVVYERSWATDQNSGQYIELDGASISSKTAGNEEYGTYGLATATQLRPDVFHNVKPTNGGCAIVIVYRES